jgi:hypothetical protein
MSIGLARKIAKLDWSHLAPCFAPVFSSGCSCGLRLALANWPLGPAKIRSPHLQRKAAAAAA